MSSFRLIAGFLLSFKSADTILAFGYIKTFAIYSGVMALFSLMLPGIYKYGKRMRLWSVSKLVSADKARDLGEDGESGKDIELTQTYTRNPLNARRKE